MNNDLKAMIDETMSSFERYVRSDCKQHYDLKSEKDEFGYLYFINLGHPASLFNFFSRIY